MADNTIMTRSRDPVEPEMSVTEEDIFGNEEEEEEQKEEEQQEEEQQLTHEEEEQLDSAIDSLVDSDKNQKSNCASFCNTFLGIHWDISVHNFIKTLKRKRVINRIICNYFENVDNYSTHIYGGINVNHFFENEAYRNQLIELYCDDVEIKYTIMKTEIGDLSKNKRTKTIADEHYMDYDFDEYYYEIEFGNPVNKYKKDNNKFNWERFYNNRITENPDRNGPEGLRRAMNSQHIYRPLKTLIERYFEMSISYIKQEQIHLLAKKVLEDAFNIINNNNPNDIINSIPAGFVHSKIITCLF